MRDHYRITSMPETCLTDRSVLAFATGGLSDAERESVHAHIDGCDDCRQLIVEAAKADHETAPALAGRTVDRYHVIRAIGAGGMGIVYLAEDAQLHRKVALKVPRASAGDQQIRALAEARAMARLAHPNVVTVFEAGTFEDQVFVAMEFVDGVTLGQWLRACERTWREVLAIMRDAGRGLVAAHAAGLLHRDFKPENVLIDREGRVRVSDFGLAHALESMTEAIPGGTPSYMAPEQLAGGTGDARSDQYSFCATLYEALYGDRVTAATATTTGPRSEPPPRRDPPRRSGVPGWLRRVLARGLTDDPSMRFSSMEELLRELAPPRWPRRVVVLAVLAVVGVCVFAIVVLATRGPQASKSGLPFRDCGPPPDDVCGSAGFCSWWPANSCGGGGAPGVCAFRPLAEHCAPVNKPVCACDGKVYDNICLARASGTGWDHYGPCRACSVTAPCDEHQYCRYPAGEACGRSGAQGICMQRSRDCTKVDAPVCACDGQTYRNTCEAHAAGASIAHTGAC
jgi:predicted Ser/Thr protein kinase